jgi:hypothetical protein
VRQASTTREVADDRSADHRCSFAFANSHRVSGFVASHNKVICGQKILRPIGRKAGYGFEFPHHSSSSLTAHRGVSVAMLSSLRLTFERKGFHDSLTHTSIVLFCVDARAVWERWCRWASFEPLSFLFSARGRRNSIAFRPYRRTPTAVVSRPLPCSGARALPECCPSKKASDRRPRLDVRFER